MLELQIFTYILIALVVILPLCFIGAALYQRNQAKENATKMKVYISTLILTYCGVGTDLMNKKGYTIKTILKKKPKYPIKNYKQ